MVGNAVAPKLLADLFKEWIGLIGEDAATFSEFFRIMTLNKHIKPSKWNDSDDQIIKLLYRLISSTPSPII